MTGWLDDPGFAAPARWQRGEVPGEPSATAITDVRAGGQMLTEVVISYPVEIDGGRLRRDCFEVDGRSVIQVFTGAVEDPESRAVSGRDVVIRLSPDDPDALLRVRPPEPSGAPRRRPALRLGAPSPFPPARYHSARATIRQRRELYTTTGTVIAPGGEPLQTVAVRHRVVDDFVQSEFHDPETGDTLPYNLFLPRGREHGRAYPLVLFMHDAGSTGDDPLTTLRQGLGATVWAQPDNQAEQPCLVLAPQYSTVIVNDASEASSALETTVHLVGEIARQHNVDRRRIYATGQSGGAMMAIAINIAHPDLFAASLIVAGQWDPEKSIPLTAQRLWIVVSEGDVKAFPGQNAITETLERHGATVGRAVWDARLPSEALDQAARELAASPAPIKYAVLKKGTVVPAGQPDDPIGNHVNTWRIAYTLPAVREWLFRQSRS
jgi:predicted peptidase